MPCTIFIFIFHQMKCWNLKLRSGKCEPDERGLESISDFISYKKKKGQHQVCWIIIVFKNRFSLSVYHFTGLCWATEQSLWPRGVFICHQSWCQYRNFGGRIWDRWNYETEVEIQGHLEDVSIVQLYCIMSAPTLPYVFLSFRYTQSSYCLDHIIDYCENCVCNEDCTDSLAHPRALIRDHEIEGGGYEKQFDMFGSHTESSTSKAIKLLGYPVSVIFLVFSMIVINKYDFRKYWVSHRISNTVIYKL